MSEGKAAFKLKKKLPLDLPVSRGESLNMQGRGVGGDWGLWVGVENGDVCVAPGAPGANAPGIPALPAWSPHLVCLPIAGA